MTQPVDPSNPWQQYCFICNAAPALFIAQSNSGTRVGFYCPQCAPHVQVLFYDASGAQVFLPTPVAPLPSDNPLTPPAP